MFKNHIRIMLRSLSRQRLFSIINVAGLAIGLACAICILLWVRHELSYDTFHENRDTLYMVNIKHPEDPDGAGDPNAPFALSPILAREYPEIVDYCRMQNLSKIMTCTITYDHGDAEGGKRLFYEEQVYMADRSFFGLFTFPFTRGNKARALAAPDAVVLSEQAAHRYFADEDPIGKTLTLNTRYTLVVSGVVRVPSNSSLQFDFVTPFESERLDDWNWSDPGFLLVDAKADIEALRAKIGGVMNAHFPRPLDKEFRVDIIPFLDRHLHFGRRIYVYVFSMVALLILAIAGINYTNLSTATAGKRSKEIAMRKVAGASRGSLFRQFLGESIIITAVAFVLALLLAELFLPVFNGLTSKQLSLFSGIEWYAYPIFVLLMIAIGTLSGLYPALHLSSRRPVRLLKQGSFVGPGRSVMRVVSVVLQFSISIALIFCTAVIHNQLSYIRNRPLGFDEDHVIRIPMNPELRRSFDTYRTELLKAPGVREVCAASALPSFIDDKTSASWEGMAENIMPVFRYTIAELDYTETFDIELAAGRSFSREVSGDRSNYVINEAAARYMGMEKPVGEPLVFWGRTGVIIGVVKDFHNISLHREIGPLIIVANPAHYRSLKHVFVKIGGAGVPETLEHIRKTTVRFAPNNPYTYRFLDEEIDNHYRSERQLGRIFGYFALFAILIACLGLFGLAAFATERRTKEIGVRKVLGASAARLIVMLTSSFSRWVLLACVTAWPVAWFAMHRWLENFAYRIEIGAGVFLFSALSAAVIALLTVSWQSFRAATANPVEVLRYE